MGGGDLNAWTKKRGGSKWDEEEEIYARSSKHNEVNKEGKRLLRILTERGWTILNGDVKGDEEGEFTYVGRGQTIDYVLVDEKMRDAMKSMEVGIEVGSEHFPIIVEIKGIEGQDIKRKEGKNNKKLRMGAWGEEKLKEFEMRMQVESNALGEKDMSVNRRLSRLREITEKVNRNIEMESVGKRGKKGWWDEECERSKTDLREHIRAWRKGWIEKKLYNKRQKKHEKLLREKKEAEKLRFMEEI